MKLLLPLFFLFFSLSAEATLSREDYDAMNWQQVENKNGIVVYEAEKEKELRGLIPLRVTTKFNHSLGRILSVIGDPTRKKEWVPYLEQAETVEMIDDNTRVEYTRYASPWPFQDRAFVVRIEGQYNPQSKSILVYMNSVVHPQIPENDKHIRGETYFGRVKLETISSTETDFDMIFVTDFKGNIPVWVINMIQKAWPRKLVERLNRQLAKEDIVVDAKYQ